MVVETEGLPKSLSAWVPILVPLVAIIGSWADSRITQRNIATEVTKLVEEVRDNRESRIRNSGEFEIFREQVAEARATGQIIVQMQSQIREFEFRLKQVEKAANLDD